MVAPIVVTNVSESYSVSFCFCTHATSIQCFLCNQALFKIKTTAPSFYTVKPAHGIVTPGGFVSISIKQTRGQPWPSPDLLDKCRDKFLVQVMILTEDLKDMPLNDLLHLSVSTQIQLLLFNHDKLVPSKFLVCSTGPITIHEGKNAMPVWASSCNPARERKS